MKNFIRLLAPLILTCCSLHSMDQIDPFSCDMLALPTEAQSELVQDAYVDEGYVEKRHIIFCLACSKIRKIGGKHLRIVSPLNVPQDVTIKNFLKIVTNGYFKLTCRTCRKSFTSSRTLNRHIEKHIRRENEHHTTNPRLTLDVYSTGDIIECFNFQ